MSTLPSTEGTGRLDQNVAVIKNNMLPKSQCDHHVEEGSHPLCKVEGGSVSPDRQRLEQDGLQPGRNF